MQTTFNTASFAWHTASAETVSHILNSSRRGLHPEEAAARLQALGPNVLPRAAGPGIPTLLWRQVNNPLIYVLLGSALLALLMGKTVDGAVVLGVVVLDMLIGFVQEYRAGRAISTPATPKSAGREKQWARPWRPRS